MSCVRKIIEFFKTWFCKDCFVKVDLVKKQEFEKQEVLKQELVKKSKELVEQSRKIVQIEERNQQQTRIIQEFEQEKKVSQRAQFWNSKWARMPVTYVSKRVNGVPVLTDVKSYIQPASTVLQGLIARAVLVGKNHDETVWNVMRWVQRSIKYVLDKKFYGLEEFWQHPEETLALQSGDCEDQAGLVVSLCLNAGVPSYKVKVCVGRTPLGGHACPIYLLDDESKWVDLDTCYLPTSISLRDRPKQSETVHSWDKPKWENIWWTFNHEHAWSPQETQVTHETFYKSVESKAMIVRLSKSQKVNP